MNEKVLNGYEHEHGHCCPPVCGDEIFNATIIEEELEVCVPIKVEPYVEVGEPTVSLIGSPCVEQINCCGWNQKGNCKYVVSQKLCVKVPLVFNAKAEANCGLSTNCFNHYYPEQEYGC